MARSGAPLARGGSEPAEIAVAAVGPRPWPEPHGRYAEISALAKCSRICGQTRSPSAVQIASMPSCSSTSSRRYAGKHRGPHIENRVPRLPLLDPLGHPERDGPGVEVEREGLGKIFASIIHPNVGVEVARELGDDLLSLGPTESPPGHSRAAVYRSIFKLQSAYSCPVLPVEDLKSAKASDGNVVRGATYRGSSARRIRERPGSSGRRG